MFFASQNPTYSGYLLDSICQALMTGNFLESLWEFFSVDLVVAGPVPIKPNNVLADFTLATFPGYATQPGGLNQASNALSVFPGGNGIGSFGDVLFVRGDGAGAAQQVIGYAISDGSGNLLNAEYFPVAENIVNPGDFISLSIFLGFNFQTQIFG